jgi:homoserine dehydrogenase
MKTYNLCLLGFGNVGRALARLLVEKSDELREEFGIRWRVTGVASRRLGWLCAPEGYAEEELIAGEIAQRAETEPRDVRGWLAAARADVLFETTSLEPLTGRAAVEHCRAALEAGAHVVTANKGAVVHGFEELKRLAAARKRRFLFEAAVADCLPVFSLFRECLPAARLLGFTALLNSTTTVVLEELERGRAFEEGVARAQSLGVAETDPSYDLDGWDAAVKVCALANVLMNASLRLEEIGREGVRGIDPRAAREAKEAGRPFRLLARADSLADGKVRASVRPAQIAPDDPLANLHGTSLSLNFRLDVLEGLTVTARSPNLKSTAYGLLADFVNAARSDAAATERAGVRAPERG